MASVIYNLVGPDHSNLGLLHNKVAYVLATRELMQLRYTTYMRGSSEYSWQSLATGLQSCVSIMLKCINMYNLIKICHVVDESYEHFQ